MNLGREKKYSIFNFLFLFFISGQKIIKKFEFDLSDYQTDIQYAQLYTYP